MCDEGASHDSQLTLTVPSDSRTVLQWASCVSSSEYLTVTAFRDDCTCSLVLEGGARSGELKAWYCCTGCRAHQTDDNCAKHNHQMGPQSPDGPCTIPKQVKVYFLIGQPH